MARPGEHMRTAAPKWGGGCACTVVLASVCCGRRRGYRHNPRYLNIALMQPHDCISTGESHALQLGPWAPICIPLGLFPYAQ